MWPDALLTTKAVAKAARRLDKPKKSPSPPKRSEPLKRKNSLKKQSSKLSVKEGSKKRDSRKKESQKLRQRVHSKAKKNFDPDRDAQPKFGLPPRKSSDKKKPKKSSPAPRKHKMKVPRLQKPSHGKREKTCGTSTEPAIHPIRTSHSRVVKRLIKRQRSKPSMPAPSWMIGR